MYHRTPIYALLPASLSTCLSAQIALLATGLLSVGLTLFWSSLSSLLLEGKVGVRKEGTDVSRLLVPFSQRRPQYPLPGSVPPNAVCQGLGDIRLDGGGHGWCSAPSKLPTRSCAFRPHAKAGLRHGFKGFRIGHFPARTPFNDPGFPRGLKRP